MLELALYPSEYPCLTRLEREARVMSERKHSESTRESSKLEHRDKVSYEAKGHKHGRNSAEDPAISSTKSDKHVPSNARNHPRAELKSSEAGHSNSKSKPASNHVHNHVSGSKRKRSNEEDEDDVWTEHVSSSGRVYFYNKKLDKSQWEKPKSFVKKAKQDATPTSGQKPKSGTPSLRPSTSASSASKDLKPSSSAPKDVKSGLSASKEVKSSSSASSKDIKSSSSSSAVKHSHLHPHSSSSSSKEKDSSHRGHVHAHVHSHGERDRDKSSHALGGSREKALSHGSRDKERERHGHYHSGSKKSPRKSPRKSHSRSVSPMTASKNSGKHRHEKTPSKHSRTNTTHSTTPTSLQTSPLTPLTVKPSGGSIAMSPGTPGIAPLLSQSLMTTQQIIEQQLIEQTSILIAQQQRMLTWTEAITPVQVFPTYATYAQGLATSTPSHPHARQRLVFPYSQPSNGPYNQDSAGSTPVQQLTPVHGSQGGSNVTSPQPLFPGGMDKLGGLHPLQKALLLQQQQQSQSYGAVDPTTQPVPLMIPANQPLQPLMSVVSAIPPRMSAQVLTSPPLSQPQSPIGSFPNPASQHGTPTAFLPGQPTNLQPLQMPVSQPSVYMSPMPQGPVPGVVYMGGHDAGIVSNSNFVPINSPTLQTPMSRLGYKDLHGAHSHSADFPDSNSLGLLPQPQANPEHFSKSLAETWWTPAHETLQKQIDSCSHEALSRKVAESMCVLGRIARSRLALDTSKVWTNSRETRISRLRTLRSEIAKR